ncbi:MAG: hypothetical protein ABSC50_12915 [Candidatus Bathyarchaeia archaeon]
MTWEPRSPAFYERARVFVKAAVTLLAPLLLSERIPTVIREKTAIGEAGTWSTSSVATPMYDIFLTTHDKQVKKLPEYGTCVDAMMSDAVIAKHLNTLIGTSGWRLLRTPWDYLSYLVAKQIPSEPRELKYDADSFDRVYRDLERFYYQETIPLHALVPLHNVSSIEEGEIILEDRLRVRKIATRELEEIFDEAQNSRLLPIPSYDIANMRYFAEITYETKKGFGNITPDSSDTELNVDELIGKVIAALRLFKFGVLGFNLVWILPLIDTPVVGTRLGSATLGYRRYVGRPYLLGAGEAVELKDFWKKIAPINLGGSDPLAIAIRRFNYAYERDKPEDRLVDYLVAFEALFFKTGEFGEFRHKLASRVARFVARDYDQRKQVFKTMGDFYDMRSKVVHGEYVTIDEGFVNNVEDLLRLSIKSFLELPPGTSHDNLIERLDLG